MAAVSMLFSDIEDSTSLVRRLGPDWLAVLAQHRRICRATWEQHRGEELATEGDSFFVVFKDPRDAIAAAVAAQQDLTAAAWPRDVGVHTRIGVHHGDALRHENGYIGVEVHRAARMCQAAHGGQILASAALIGAVDALPDTVVATDLGQHQLRSLGTRLHLFQLTTPLLPTTFGPPRQREPEPFGATPMVSGAVITVASIDNHEVVREGVTARLQREPDLDVVASVATVEEYLETSDERAQVVLLDLWLDAGDATGAIGLLRRDSKVLVCTTEQRPEYLRRAVAAGATGVLLKRDPIATIITGVRRAAAGEFYCSSSLAHALLTAASPTAPLEVDERGILEGLARGLDDGAVAAGLGLTVSDVRHRLRVVRDKLRSVLGDVET